MKLASFQPVLKPFIVLTTMMFSLVSYGNSEILELRKELKKTSDPEEQFYIYYNLIQQYKTVDLDSAILVANEAIAIAQLSEDSVKIVKYTALKSASIRLQGKCTESKELSFEYLDLAKRLVPEFASVFFFEVGESYKCLGRSDSTLYYFFKSNEFCRTIENEKCSDCLTPIAEEYLEAGRFREAYEICQQALDEDRFERKAQKYIAAYYKVLATQGMVDAEKWIEANRSLDALKLKMGFDSLSVFHYNHLEIKNLPPEKEEAFLNDALVYAEKQGHDNSMSRIILALSSLYRKQKNFKSFEKHFSNHFNGLQSFPYVRETMAKHYSEMLKDNKQYESALTWSEYYISQKDSLDKINSQKLIFELQEKYQSSEKEKEIAENETIIQARTNQRNIFLSTGLAILLLSLLAFSRFRSKQKLDSSRILHLEKEKKILSMNALLEGQEAERMRIAKDLHDGLGGLLSTVRARLSKINAEVTKIESYNIYEKTTELVDDACNEVRRISHNLLPGALRLDGLKTAVELLGEELNDAHPFKVKVEVLGLENKISETQEVFFYRIIQETTNNIIKYAEADNVLIQFSESEDEYHLIIEDDGKGFDLKSIEPNRGLGLKSIRSRVDHLSGTLDISSKLGEGTSISIHAPKLDPHA